jgi:hypothetical protein
MKDTNNKLMESKDATLGFEYQIRKNGEVEIMRFGHRVTTLRGMGAKEFLAEVLGAGEKEIQQEMARLTGNYKRGNERTAANHIRNR